MDTIPDETLSRIFDFRIRRQNLMSNLYPLKLVSKRWNVVFNSKIKLQLFKENSVKYVFHTPEETRIILPEYSAYLGFNPLKSIYLKRNGITTSYTLFKHDALRIGVHKFPYNSFVNLKRSKIFSHILFYTSRVKDNIYLIAFDFLEKTYKISCRKRGALRSTNLTDEQYQKQVGNMAISLEFPREDPYMDKSAEATVSWLIMKFLAFY